MKVQGKTAKQYRLELVVKLHQEGHTQVKIAELSQLSQSRVSTILKIYRQKGKSGLQIKSPPGRPAGLKDEDLTKLGQILKAEALAWGFPTDGWTLKRIAKVVEAEFGKPYSLEHIRRLLKKIGFSRQRPQAKDYRQDNQAVESWQTQKLPMLKKSEE